MLKSWEWEGENDPQLCGGPSLLASEWVPNLPSSPGGTVALSILPGWPCIQPSPRKPGPESPFLLGSGGQDISMAGDDDSESEA